MEKLLLPLHCQTFQAVCLSFAQIWNKLIINKKYNNVKWYGRGPHENYQDRKTSSLVGIYEAKVSELYYPYI